MNNLKTKNKMNNKINLKFCLITLLLMCCVSINAQQSVTVNLKNASLKQVFNAIEKQTTYRFSYRNVVIDSRHDINVSCSKAKVNTVLDIALRGRDLTYSVVSNKSIVITDKARQTVERAQQNDETLHGVISDRNGEPIIGATVMEKGSKNGTVTDVNGQFSLKAQPGNTLVVSYIGFADKEVRAARQMEITMMEQSENLDEVVVVGYGTMKKSDMTGAISTVKTEDLVKRTTTNPAEALQGKVAGVNIMKSGGLAGSSVSVKIRGVKTFGSNEPLYIIDGFQGDITSVNPQDIESMEIMKDGAAAAIYGSVAANGVVIVTTKNGKKGDMKIDFNSYLSFTSIAKKLQMLDADGYKKVHKMMYDNYNAQYPDNAVSLPAYITNETGVNTDWQDAAERNGLAQNYMISMRGGSEKALYSLSYNHAFEKGIFVGNDFRQDNARMKLHMQKSIVDIDANLAFKFTDSKTPQYSIKEMYMISPLVPIYNSKEKYGFGLTNFDGLPNNRNVMADNYYRKSDGKTYHTDGNIALTFNFTKWLNFKTSYSYRGEHNRSSYHAPDYIADVKSKNTYPYNSESSSYWEEHVFDNVLTFNKTFGDHSLNVMLGTSITATRSNWNSVAVEGKKVVYKVEDGKLVTSEEEAGFLSHDFETIDAGQGGTYSGSGSNYKYNRASFFGRLNYNYANRYLLQFTMRRDGSSKFGADSRWGNFPSVALGWRITEEPFFPKGTPVSNLKLRASWGQLGNENALGYYDFLALISTDNTMYQGYVKGSGSTAWPGSIARGLENRSLKWETTDTKNIGIDFGLFDNQLSGSFNVYRNETRDLLIYKELAPSVGLSSPVLNVGKIRNTGIELEVNWNSQIKDFVYNIGFNLSTVHNKVVKLSDPDQVLYGEGLKYGTEHFPTQTKVGKPIGAFYLYQTDGLFQTMEEVKNYVDKDGNMIQPNAQPGDVKFKDINGNGVIDEDDKVYSGSGIPKLEANINLSAAWKGVDLSMVLSSGWGHKIYNGNKYFYEGMNSGSNFLASALDAWTPTNTNTDVPRAVYQDPNGNTRESTRFLEKGDFVRMRQLQIGYTLPKLLTQKAYIERARFYVSAENLFTITGYDGIDPEFSRNSVLNAGIDNLIYPFTRSFTVGVQITL
jgi:TonB-linked SusC/RagA family outer membrane protein